MVEVKLEEKDFEELLSYCLNRKNHGNMKYFWEISVPDYAYDRFIKWIEKCEDAELTFVFAVIRCYEGHRLLYGFSNFEILDDMEIRCFDFELRNDDILCDKFRNWKYESEHIIMPFSLLGYLKVMEIISENYDEIKDMHQNEED